MTRPARRAFHTLDGLRGIAALLVVTRHSNGLALGLRFPEVYLAVDLFFLLSGFVIAHAYDSRLAKPGFREKFLAIRLVRLYPLYILGIALGALHRLGSLTQHRPGESAQRLIVDFVLGALFLSSVLDGPTWTLLPELIANVIYAIFFRWLTRPVLAVLVAFGALGVVLCRLHYGTLDAGWSLSQLPVIAARLAFSFFGGTLLYRTVNMERKTETAKACFCVAGVGLMLIVAPTQRFSAIYELALILLVFPAVVCMASIYEPSESIGKFFRFLGLISYAVYVLHQPAGVLLSTVLSHGAHLNLSKPGSAHAGLIMLFFFLISGSWLVDRLYDAPVRKLLSRKLGLATRSA